jgi:carotenoid 1,2-hydratase
VSDDGAFAVVVIVLLGNPFSPAYAVARARGVARALDFCSLHVALHGPGRSVWSLVERPLPDAARRGDSVTMGRSRVSIDRDALVIHVNERATPFAGMPGGLVKGRVKLRPECAASGPVALDGAEKHRWWPVAPLAQVEVDFESPRVRFRGHGYHDANSGASAIDDGFAGWTWSRARVGDRVVVAYDVVERSGDERMRGLVFGAGTCSAFEPAWRAPLGATAWRLARSVAADEGYGAKIQRTLTDSPFYARSLVRTRLIGCKALAMHEVLSADRLRRGWVRFLLGFRMGRGAR